MGIFFKGTNSRVGSGKDIEGADSRKGFYWVDDQKGENVIWRLPRNVMWNDNVLVREDEYGIFFRDGKALAVFDRPDRYALTTENIPVLKEAIGVVVGSTQIGEFYWAQKREFRDKFGTIQPLAFRDTDFGVVQLRIFGQFSYKVVEPMAFITQFVGTKGLTKSSEIVDWLKDQIIMIINDTLGELKDKKQMGVLDMPAYLQEIEQLCLARLKTDTEVYGLRIMKLTGININLPDEVQEAVNKRGAMSALGVNYIQYQSGKAIEGIGAGAAMGGGEGAGFALMGAGMGAGLGMGNMMSQGMANTGKPAPFGATSPQQQAMMQNATVASTMATTLSSMIKCSKCGATVPAGTKFCPECGEPIVSQGQKCPKCGTVVVAGTKFCPECGTRISQSLKCSKCGADITAETKFCPECGQKI